MRIVSTNLPPYTAIFEHPDEGVRVITFFVEDGQEPSPFAEEEEWAEWRKAMIKEVWETYNHSGYYHTMSITAECVVDGKAYLTDICKEIGIGEIYKESL